MESVPFFVPATEDLAQAHRVWQACRLLAEEQVGRPVTDQAYFQLNYSHNGKPMVAEVGKADIDGEIVVAILETADMFLICTKNRGAARGLPILVDRASVRTATCFTGGHES